MNYSISVSQLSIIILVHNSEKTLPGCLESIADLRSQGAEIIVINDGSTDHSLEIAQRWLDCSNSILVDKPWSGIGHSRNVGLNVSTRSWLTFLDSDDRLVSGGVQSALTEVGSGEADVVRCRNRIVRVCQEGEYHIGSVPRINYRTSQSSLIEPTTGLHGVIYRREFLRANEIVFPDCQMGEDLVFNFKVVSRNPRFREITEVGYEYFIGRNDQVTSKRYSAVELLHNFDSLMQETQGLPNMRKLYWRIILRVLSGALRRDPGEFGEVIRGLLKRTEQLPRGRRESLGALLSLAFVHRTSLFSYMYRLVSGSREPLSTFQ